ncbi:serine hydrolase [Planomicrobium sp. CPCC 101079]|uniref:serine hydrolase n=1 Tax=Planomicrobium sp. CPCC 101079 TaxID=2599618 RepID=UPI0011B40E5D|nr:serine hydrolase [Planomicrobium sp. CPCC 101079]TWT02317.1 serine hydrolase [Planomicrobium sp. CPCC 101079]
MFKKVTLYTNRLEELKGFYEYQLGFRIVEEDEVGFTLSIGESQLVFKKSERKAFYHFAFNIPGNQFTLAKSWANSRVTLNRQDGMDEIYYANFNADAFYFQDPAGNVIEFIARRNVDRMGDFTVDSLLNISEVSITTPHVKEIGHRLEEMDIPVRGNKGIEPHTLNFLGRDDTFLLLVPPKRVWYFSKQKSETHPLSVELMDGRQIDITDDGEFKKTDAGNPISDKLEEMEFSGVALLKQKETWSTAKGLADRANERPNAIDTRFGIASGCKIFTAVIICQLVEEGHLSFEAKLSELLPGQFPDFPVTIHQLLTHTSGIPDYFDEETMDDFEELWRERPMYTMKTGSDFLPFFQNKPMISAPGDRFQYNNAGFITLGLVVEKLTGQPFIEAVEERVFARAEMAGSGYFSLDQLPAQTAFGYIEEKNAWRTNQYAIPIIGGADGGAFVTANDMVRFWERLMDYTLLSENMTDRMLSSHVTGESGNYGYGVWIEQQNGTATKYHVMGYDPGVSFHSGYYPEDGSVLTVLSNKSNGAFDAMKLIESALASKAEQI